MALRLRASKDIKKSSYYVWYLGAKEAKGVDAMPGAIMYLLERERLQEPFKVTLQVRYKNVLINREKKKCFQFQMSKKELSLFSIIIWAMTLYYEKNLGKYINLIEKKENLLHIRIITYYINYEMPSFYNFLVNGINRQLNFSDSFLFCDVYINK